jgi:flagellar M-ring protein FliF
LEKLFIVGKQNELQGILRAMKGVESAAVLYDEQKGRGLERRSVSTASVSIKPVGSQPLDKERIPAIRHLVASAFAGLKSENVSVTDLNGRTYSGRSSDGGLGPADEDQYISRKEANEKIYQDKISDLLMSFIPGVVVTVNVELIRDTEYEESKTILDPKGVTATSNESNSTKTSEGPAPAGRVGVVAQQPGAANQAGAVGTNATGPKMSEETNQLQTTTAIPVTEIHRKQQGLTPERAKVAVAIPSSYYDKVWYERNPPAAGQDPKKPDAAALAEIERKVKEDVQNAVLALLPVTDPTKDPFPQVVVTSFQHITTAPPPVPGMQDHAVAWLGQYWTTLGMGGLALVSLLMLRSVARSVGGPPTPTAATAQAEGSTGLSLVTSDDVTDETTAASEETAAPRNRLRRRSVSGPSLREELTTIVKEDPDAAVAVLRNWISVGS